MGTALAMVLLWLPVLLTPISCLLQTDQDPNPPIKNLRMDPRTKILTWDIHGNVSAIECCINSKSNTKAQKNRFCKFHVLPKCKASNFTVKVTTTDGETFSTWIQYPKQEGNPEAAPQNLDCQVHDKDFLTCSWAVGKEAPSDVQYYLYLENINTSQKWECSNYTANELGQHIQCQFDDVSQFSEDQYRFLARGTSNESTVPCSELITYLSDIEKLIAPKITVSCNQSLAFMKWNMSSHFHQTFDYKLEIQQRSDPPFIQMAPLKNSFMLTNPGTFTVRIRALAMLQSPGQWSTPQRFVCDYEEDTFLQIWLTSSLIALATLVTVGTALLLCKRYSVLKMLFPPIPHAKDPTGDNFQDEKMVCPGFCGG